MSEAARRGMRSAQVGMLINAVLAVIKLVAGIVGNTYALVADAVESTADIVASFVVWGGLRLASRNPDEEYPFGYGKAESLAAALVAIMLIGAASGIAFEAIREIRTPHHTPAAWTRTRTSPGPGVRSSISSTRRDRSSWIRTARI